jgi:hypothetical protein
MLTDDQKAFIEISKKTESLKQQLKASQEELDVLLNKIGIGNAFQDPSDKTVFEIVKPKGTFISFKDIDYNRTKREGEAKGDLSMARAKELGFSI